MWMFMYSLFMPLTLKKRAKKATWNNFLCRSFLGGTRWAERFFSSSSVLQSPMQTADFAPRNGRGSAEEKRRWSTQLQAFSLLSKAPKGPGEMRYKLPVLTYAGDRVGTRWPLYVLTKISLTITLILIFPLSTMDGEQSWGQSFKSATLILQETGNTSFSPRSMNHQTSHSSCSIFR